MEVKSSHTLVRGSGNDTATAATACHRMEPERGHGAGACGARFGAGAVQQEGVEQLAGSERQHLQVDFGLAWGAKLMAAP